MRKQTFSAKQIDEIKSKITKLLRYDNSFEIYHKPGDYIINVVCSIFILDDILAIQKICKNIKARKISLTQDPASNKVNLRIALKTYPYMS